MKKEKVIFEGFSNSRSFVNPEQGIFGKLLNIGLSMNWLEWIILAIQLTCPYKDMRFVGYYFYLVRERSNSKLKYLAKAFIFIMYYNAVRYLILVLFDFDHFGKVVLYDVFYVMELFGGRELNMVFLVACISCAQMMRYLVFHPKCTINLIIEKILLGDLSFFLYPTFNNAPINVKLRRMCLILMNTMQWFLILEELFGTIAWFYIIRGMLHHWPDFMGSDDGKLLLAYHLISGFFAFIFMMTFLEMLLYVPLLQILYSQVVFIRFKQCHALVTKLNNKFHHGQAIKYRKSFLETLQYFFRFNSVHSQVFLQYLIVNCPLNAMFGMYLILMDLGRVYQAFGWAIYAAQLVGLFVVHYMLARIHRTIRLSAKSINSVIVCQQKYLRKNTTLNLRLSAFCMTFHNNSPYGPTYGSFGHVTMNTLFKYILLYGNLCMKIKKII